MLHTRAHSAPGETAESCGTAPSATTTIPLPYAQTPLTAHGSPTAAHDARRISPSFQQKPAPTPQRPQSPMCNTDGNHTRQAYPSTPHTEIGRVPARDRFDFGPADPTSRHARRTRGQRPHATIRNRRRAADRRQRNRSRGGIRPISTRNRTDLGAGYDRSRRGIRPISALGVTPQTTTSPRRRTRTGARSASVTTRSAHLPGSRAPIESSPRTSAP